ncbi:hypothetical protein CPB83DRAFT_852861, partial [Crepidotus variabilis]
MSHYSRRNLMYPHGLKHSQPWSDDRRAGDTRMMDVERLRLDRHAAPLHNRSHSRTHIPSDRRSSFLNTIVPDVRINRSTYATPFDGSTWSNDYPVHTPEWRSQRDLADESNLHSFPPQIYNFSSDNRMPPSSSMLGYNYDILRHNQPPSFDSQTYHHATFDLGHEQSPPPPYTPDPATTTGRGGCSSRQSVQTARSRHPPSSSPSQMQMVRYDPNSVDHDDRQNIGSSGFAASEPPSSAGTDTRRSSNWSNSANHGSIGHFSPQPYHSEYTHFSNPSAAYPHYNMTSYQNYRENHGDIFEDVDDDDCMSDGVASDEGVYYSSDGGQFDSFGEDEFEVFSDDGHTSPIDDFYGD